MKWFYTEGKLTVSSEQQERNFMLDNLILENAQRNSLLITVIVVFIVTLIILGILQFVLTTFPVEQSVYFYLGYLSTPVLIAAILSLIIFAVLRRKRLEIKAVRKLFKG
jgi:amino acid transporter|tara:strand:+ start:156 stop:482 length:327 start_codon:yes stop_codon:yes gene_type:complete